MIALGACFLLTVAGLVLVQGAYHTKPPSPGQWIFGWVTFLAGIGGIISC